MKQKKMMTMVREKITRTEFRAFSVEVPEGDSIAQERFRAVIAAEVEALKAVVKREAARLDVSEDVAECIVRFRSRSWWTPEREEELIMQSRRDRRRLQSP